MQIKTSSVWKCKIKNSSISKDLPFILEKEEVFYIYLSSKGLKCSRELVDTEKDSEIYFSPEIVETRTQSP